MIQQLVPGTEYALCYPQPVAHLPQLLALHRDYAHFLAVQPDKIPPKDWVFKQIVNLIWGEHNRIKHYKWNPWAERMCQAEHQHKYLGMAGCASSGKSTAAALYGLVFWLEDPQHSMVLMTSTSLKDSRKRIWGEVTKLWQAAGGERALPGKLVDSMGIIRTDDGSGVFNDKAGVALIAGEKKKEREAIGKLIGLHQKRVLLIADEMPELSPAIFEAAISNLSTAPHFQMIALGNLCSWYDAFGEFVRPKGGLDSIGPDCEEWETDRGLCLHFDGMKSPNIMEGKDVYPGIYSSKDLKEHRDKQGPNSLSFWRMCRSFPAPIGADNIIYSEADLVSGHVEDRVMWLRPPIPVVAMDPSYTTGGDRTIVVLADWGQATDQKWVLQVRQVRQLLEDADKKDKPRSIQIAEKFIDFCVTNKVRPEHAALDATAAGRVLHDIIWEKWSKSVLDVEFGGLPTELPANINGARTCREAYDRKVSELWYAGLDFVRSGQIKGLTPEICNELKARKYLLRKGATVKVSVESKRDMKERIGFSPDQADALMCAIFLVRTRLNAQPGLPTGVRAKSAQNAKRKALEFDAVHEVVYAEA